jgi:hypothetical protein
MARLELDFELPTRFVDILSGCSSLFEISSIHVPGEQRDRNRHVMVKYSFEKKI